MPEKNYLSREESKIWEYIQDKEIVDIELIKQVFPETPKNKRNKILHSLYRKGYLKRAKRELYYNPLKLKNFYKLALRMREGYIGLSSALRYYNLIEYEDFTIFVMTKSFSKTIALEGTKYQISFIPLKNLFTGFEKKEDLYISSIEKTFFDCLLKPRHIGFTNLTKAFYEAKINWNEFISFFRLTDNSSLCQRTGYLLELMKKNIRFRVPQFIFDFLLKKVKSPVKLIPIKGKSIFIKKWKLQDNLGKDKILSWWY